MKRELERKIFDLQTSVDEVDRGNDKRLKKELKKYRMLYRDAKKATETQVTLRVSQIFLKIHVDLILWINFFARAIKKNKVLKNKERIISLLLVSI